MPKVACLNSRRADKFQDSRLWTPLECLEELIGEIKSGKVNPTMLCVHFWEQKEKEGPRTKGVTCAGLTYPEHIALLNVALKDTIEDWTG